MYDWEFVWNIIDRGRGISGGKAARDGVATDKILVYEEGVGGDSLSPYSLRIILVKYGLYWIFLWCRL